MTGFSGETGILPGTGEENEQPERSEDPVEQKSPAENPVHEVSFGGKVFSVRARGEGEAVDGFGLQMTRKSKDLNDPFLFSDDPRLTFEPAAYLGSGDFVATHVLENGHSVVVVYTQQGKTYNAGVFIDDDGARCIKSDPRFTQSELDAEVVRAIAKAEALPTMEKEDHSN